MMPLNNSSEVFMKHQTFFSMLLLAIILFGCAKGEAQLSTGSNARKPTNDEVEMAAIKEQVRLNQSQLTKIYTRETAIYSNQYGMLEIMLYIDEKGKVFDAEITPKSGRFTTTLLKKMKNQVLDWKFQNTQKRIYGFSIRLAKD